MELKLQVIRVAGKNKVNYLFNQERLVKICKTLYWIIRKTSKRRL